MNRIALLLLLAPLAPLAAASPHAAPARKLGPRDVLWRLRKGNQAFVAGRLTPAKAAPARRAAVVGGQHPHAVVVSCADSRVPPEHIFNEGIGDLFVVRVAGVVADPVVVGSIEYAAEHLHTPLIVVLGHTRCGAVKAAMESKAPGHAGGPGANIEDILARLRPGLGKSEPRGDAWTTAVYGGLEQSVADILKLSRIVPEMAHEGKLGLIAGVYELETGKVVFSEMVAAGGQEAAGRYVRWGAPRQLARSH